MTLNPIGQVPSRITTTSTGEENAATQTVETEVGTAAPLTKEEKKKIYAQLPSLQKKINQLQQLLSFDDNEVTATRSLQKELKELKKLRVELLNRLNYKKDLNEALFKAIKEKTPEENQLKTIEQLIKGGADPNLVNDNGQLLLNVALQLSRPKIASLLISQKVDPLLKDSNGKTAFFFLGKISMNPSEICDLMFHCSDLPIKEILAQQDDEKSTPLHSIISVCRCKNFIKYLVKKGADPDVQIPESKVTPLHKYVMDNGSQEVVEELISVGAHLESKNREGETPLALAVKLKKLEAAQFLIAQGAHVDADVLDKACNGSDLEKNFAKFLFSLGFFRDDEQKLFFAVRFDLSEEIKGLLKQNWSQETLDKILEYQVLNRRNSLISNLLLDSGANPSEKIKKHPNITSIINYDSSDDS